VPHPVPNILGGTYINSNIIVTQKHIEYATSSTGGGRKGSLKKDEVDSSRKLMPNIAVSFPNQFKHIAYENWISRLDTDRFQPSAASLEKTDELKCRKDKSIIYKQPTRRLILTYSVLQCHEN
jgi:hypothetical protein